MCIKTSRTIHENTFAFPPSMEIKNQKSATFNNIETEGKY